MRRDRGTESKRGRELGGREGQILREKESGEGEREEGTESKKGREWVGTEGQRVREEESGEGERDKE